MMCLHFPSLKLELETAQMSCQMSAVYQILIQHKANLEDSLDCANLIKLSKELLKHQIFSREFHDRFSSLDEDHLESDIKVRYLLQQVCERVREDGEVFQRLVRVLGKLRVENVRVECEAMKKELVKFKGVRAASVEGERCLVEQDVSGLVEVIVSGSHLWDAIGIALNLPKHKRIDCSKGEEESVSKLSNILTTWILGSYEGARPATLSSLREALASETVGLGRLAQDLSQYECCMEIKGAMKQESFSKKTTILYQTYDTEVAEGKSTLLEVQVSSNRRESYQWKKDQDPLANGANFSGVCSNILYINRASQCTEGEYSCCVSQYNDEVCSGKINVKVVYPPEKQQLLEFYSVTESEVTPQEDSWPPVSNSTFINLVLIKQKPMSTCDYYTIRGDMDDILESKEVAEYEDVFREYKEGALVLVEGRPGSGKTTLVHKLTRDWAAGKKVLHGAKMVFLITLRLLNASGKDESLLDLLQIFYGEISGRAVEHGLQECRGKGACFILDGLDEYPTEKKNLVINHLLFSKSFLPLSMVIVASRPVATSDLKITCKTRLEVVGFSKDQIYSYIRSYPFSDSSNMVFRMQQFLDQHLNVLHMCYLPVHASMICFLFSQLEGNIPHRETQIYEQFTIATLLKHNVRRGKSLQLRSLRELKGQEKELFDSVCKLAFDMIINYQQVVSKSDAQVSLFLDSVYGLLTVERTSKYYGSEDFYTFHHLTFQEFLAAFYIVEAHLEDIKLVNKTSLRNVWKFYSGLCGSNVNARFAKKIMATYGFNSLFSAQYAFESQLPQLCDLVVRDGILKIPSGIITATDFVALSYVIFKTTKLIKTITFGYSVCDSEGLQSLYIFASKVKLKSILCLEVRYTLHNDEINALNCLLYHLPFFEKLDLSKLKLSRSVIENLTSGLKLPNLKVLKITLSQPCSYPEEILKLLTFGSHNVRQVFYTVDKRFSFYRDLYRKALCCAFGNSGHVSWFHIYNTDKLSLLPHKQLSNCAEIVLVNCCIGDEGAETLANTLNAQVLENLVLDFNRISDSGAVVLARCLARCSLVQEVSIQCNSIGDSGAIALASALVHCSTLRKLDLQGNSLGDEGAVAMAITMEGLSCLDLYLHNVSVTNEGIENVLEHRSSTSIRRMVYTSSWDRVIEAGIENLTNALYCQNLPVLTQSCINNFSIDELKLAGLGSIRGLEVGCIANEAVPSLCKIIDSFKTINYVNCTLKNISSVAAHQFCDSLNGLKSCKSLSVTFNSTKCYSMIIILEQCINFMHSLSLSYLVGLNDISLIFSDPKSCFNLHSLSLVGCVMGPDDAQCISGVIAHCKRLRHLNLCYNGIGDSGAKAIAEGLKNHTSLIELYLGHNAITADGVAALSQVIGRNRIHHFDIDVNRIHCEGVTVLVDVLGEAVQRLNLNDNKIGVEGVASLSVGLKKFTHLIELDTGNNGIDSCGLVYLARGLQCCINLQYLNISDNYITSDGVPAMLCVLKSCKNLQKIDLDRNNIGIEGGVVLVSGWQHRTVLTLNLSGCFGDPHESALCDLKECCSGCDNLLQLYYNNEYVHIDLNTHIPKRLSLES